MYFYNIEYSKTIYKKEWLKYKEIEKKM